jgi:hypothetical protein
MGARRTLVLYSHPLARCCCWCYPIRNRGSSGANGERALHTTISFGSCSRHFLAYVLWCILVTKTYTKTITYSYGNVMYIYIYVIRQSRHALYCTVQYEYILFGSYATVQTESTMTTTGNDRFKINTVHRHEYCLAT